MLIGLILIYVFILIFFIQIGLRMKDLCCDSSSVSAYISTGLINYPNLEKFVGNKCQFTVLGMRDFDNIIGWGMKPSTRRARKIAHRKNIPFIALEDGFLRSVGLGVNGAVPFSLVVDNIGIYYNAQEPSLLEVLIKDIDLTPDKYRYAKDCMGLVIDNRLTKYNTGQNSYSIDGSSGRKKILVVDQTYGDCSISYGMADDQSFRDMLESALADNPDADIFIKVHPDVLTGKKKGYLTQAQENTRCIIVSDNISSWAILDHVDTVYVVTSQLGFDALLAGKEVHCFGMPFYAGWGLTIDSHNCSRRNVSRSLEEVFYAAYVQYSRYVIPESGLVCDLKDIIGHILFEKKSYS